MASVEQIGVSATIDECRSMGLLHQRTIPPHQKAFLVEVGSMVLTAEGHRPPSRLLAFATGVENVASTIIAAPFIPLTRAGFRALGLNEQP